MQVNHICVGNWFSDLADMLGVDLRGKYCVWSLKPVALCYHKDK